MTGLAGRFTLDGSDAAETATRAVVDDVAAALSSALDPAEFKAVVLIGGYGRGEGGVELRDGVERPHNNLDFLLIARRADPVRQRARLDPLLQEIAQRHGVGVDLGIVSAAALRRSPCLVMWYDMRFGHKTVLGDAAFVPRLERFTVERIVPWDVRNLLTNRGTLLLINDALLARGALTADERRTVIKHAVKAIIGYGDALLFFLGAYHWSYAEKQRRMRSRTDVSPEFRALYDSAVAFRFRPDYAAWEGRDLAAWTGEVKAQLAPVHLQTEVRRLAKPALRWEELLETALVREVRQDLPSPLAAAKKIRNALRPQRFVPGLSPEAQLGLRVAGPRGALPLTFAAAAYEGMDAAFRTRAQRILGARDPSAAALRRAYLRAWAVHGDPNFPHVLRRLSLSLDDEVSAS